MVGTRPVVLLGGVALIAVAMGCARTEPEPASSIAPVRQVSYLKAANPDMGDHFACGGSLPGHIGSALATSADGNTIVVGAPHESSAARGINGDAAIPPEQRPAMPQGGGEGPALGRGFPGRTNILVQRFKANPEFAALYDTALNTLRSELYASGTAANILESRVDLLRSAATDLVDEATVTSEAASVSRYFTSS